jgi:hypothetical protein
VLAARGKANIHTSGLGAVRLRQGFRFRRPCGHVSARVGGEGQPIPTEGPPEDGLPSGVSLPATLGPGDATPEIAVDVVVADSNVSEDINPPRILQALNDPVKVWNGRFKSLGLGKDASDVPGDPSSSSESAERQTEPAGSSAGASSVGGDGIPTADGAPSINQDDERGAQQEAPSDASEPSTSLPAVVAAVPGKKKGLKIKIPRLRMPDIRPQVLVERFTTWRRRGTYVPLTFKVWLLCAESPFPL